jgi:hypothetical protein
MSDFAHMSAYVIVENHEEGSDTAVKKIKYLDVPFDVLSAEDAATGIQELLDAIDLQEWFDKKKIVKQT